MKNIINILKKSKRVGIIAHISPDEDCLGSMSALSLMLKQKGINVDMFVDTNKEPEEMPIFKFTKRLDADLDINLYDTLISVDVPTKRMLGKYGEAFCSFKNAIAIDHHDVRDLEARAVYNEPQSSSCSEIIFKMAQLMKVKITKEIATHLFAGIVGDTGCFEHDNVTNNTHLIASQLYKMGADASCVLFWQKKHQTSADIKLRKCVYENMVMKDDIAYMIFTLKIQKECGTDNTKKYVNELLYTDNNVFAFIINQKEKNTYTVSVRCKQGYNACEVASRFGGGGHIQAAGFSFVGAPVKHAKLIFEECKKQIMNKR